MERHQASVASLVPAAHAKPAKRSLCAAALLGAVIGLVAFLPILLRNHGEYMELGDYFQQYVPFLKELRRMLTSGSLSWSWNSFLGDSFVNAYSYYTVFNPFAWLVLLFPDEYILYGTMFATLVKLSVCMITAMLYLRLFCKTDTYALLGALLYTFSGFTLVNTLFYFFLDVIAVFPLLLYALERLISGGRRSAYILALALNAAINYYFFVSTVFLTLLYVLFRLELYRPAMWKTHRRLFLRIAISSIIGTGLAGFALVPSFYTVLGSNKARSLIGSGIQPFFAAQVMLERFKALIAPIESARYHAFYDGASWSSTAVYLPVFGSVCALDWCLRRTDWLKKLCIALLICFFVPLLSGLFCLYSCTVYTRWLYGPVLLISLVTARRLEELSENDEPINRKLLLGVTIFTAGLHLFPTVIYLLHDFCGLSLVSRFASACVAGSFMGYRALVIMLALTAVNYIGLWYLTGGRKRRTRAVLAVVIAACALNYGVFNEINYSVHAAANPYDTYYESALVNGYEHNSSFEYRIDHPSLLFNYSLFWNQPSVINYNSLQNSGSSRFARAVGYNYDGTNDARLKPAEESRVFTDALLSVRYYYDFDNSADIPDGFSYLRTENGVDIYENENYIPMGFVYDAYRLEEELTDASPEARAEVLLETLVVAQSDEETARQYLTHQPETTCSAALSELISHRRETVCSRFEGTTEGFTAEISLERDNIVFFSIPDDSGWEITVNGAPANTVTVNYGLLGICCSAGSNTICAVYHTKGWTLGVSCSLVCLAAWGALTLLSRRKRRAMLHS